MNEIEIIVLVILLLMGIPDLCRKIGRPALAYVAYLLVGFVAGPVITADAKELLHAAGNFGFILLLFGIGLEIDLPALKDLRHTVGTTAKWVLFQLPLCFLLAVTAGIPFGESFLAAVALSSCSVGLAYSALQQLPNMSDTARRNILFVMVILEIQALIVLSAGAAYIKTGFGWKFGLQLAGITAAIFLIGYSANHLTRLTLFLIGKTMQWRVHIIVLFVLLVAAVGERLGLSSAKTAFFLGLFMNRATHQGMAIEKHLAPLSTRLLIPIFLVALGTTIPIRLLFSYISLLAFLSAILMVAYRHIVYQRAMPPVGHPRAFFLLCPNLTLVAVVLQILNTHGASASTIGWIAFSGLFVTLFSIVGLPKLTFSQTRQLRLDPAAIENKLDAPSL